MRLEQLGAELHKHIKGDTLMIVTDETVADLYLDRCISTVSDGGFEVHAFVIEPGEHSKNGDTYLALLGALAEIPLTRADGIIALGGGVVGDLAGFAAATYLRGIPVIQVPTTLLAAVDSSVGGKTAINLPEGKNLAGAFHQPAFVCQDTSLLATLPEEIYLDGMAEVIKYGIIADADLLTQLQDPDYVKANLDDIISRCVAIKKRFVEEDEHDTGVRQMLNFGHTIGHAIEIASDFDIRHGFAVAKGMAYMAEIAARENWCDVATRDAIIHILETYHYDLSVDFDKEALADIMGKDKKRKGAFLDLVVPTAIGSCRLQRISAEEIERLL
ncbi:MAG: 3-dehydroquinate synthase [Firmicutes bacterium]|nr:3-dehydroquinate synthase [Bacillota bacterium]